MMNESIWTPLGGIAVVLVIGLALFTLWGCRKKTVTETRTVEHGPFTIQSETVSSRYFNMNFGRMSTHVRSDYHILYRGAPVVFPAALQTNTGYSNLWKAYILEDAPQPTLIAGSQSMYLITEAEEQVKLTALDEQSSGFAGLQWLDSDAGQPEGYGEVYMSDDEDSTLTLTGGNYLLISNRTVLRVSDLAIYPLDHGNWIGDYYILSSKGAVTFSPDQRQLAFVGSKNDENDYLKYLYALLVFDYTTGERYVVPFNQTDTRMRDIHSINQDWLRTFFEWKPDSAGHYRLNLRQLEKLPSWQGWFSDDDNYYNVQPVSEELLPVFADFVLKHWNLPQEVMEAETVVEFQYIYIQLGQQKFSVGYRAVEKKLHFSKRLFEPDSEDYRSRVMEIGKAFNEALANGEYQEFFTTY